MIRRIAALGLLGAITAGLSSCGGGGRPDAVAQVAGVPIAAAMLNHWTAVMNTEHTTLMSSETMRQHALSFLISSLWLIEQAAAQGLGVSQAEVQRRVQERVHAHANGASEFREYLQLSGQTMADVMFDAKAEVAAAKLHRVLRAWKEII